MTPEFDKVYEGLWDNINKAKKRGKTSSKWKKSSKYRKQMKNQAKKLAKEKKLCARGKAAAKAKFDVYPSAYANAYASKVCAGKVKDNKGKKRRDWKKKGEAVQHNDKLVGSEGLKDWFKQKWVNIGARKKGGKYQPCGRKDADTGKYPKCVPAKKAYSMSKGQKSASVSRKRKAERKGRSGKKPNYSKT